MNTSITFLGASGTVTGSKYLVESKKGRILVDCGMFQGDKEWTKKNWEEPPVDLASIDAVVLTHAHIDHTGMLPRFVALGLNCPIYCTAATASLTQLLLLDSARLQEEEAEYRREKVGSRHTPPLPLYTEEDAEAAIALLRPIASGIPHTLKEGITAVWTPIGHMLGASSIALTCSELQITFSGDIGRYTDFILPPPSPVARGSVLLIESTYGDRLHQEKDPRGALARVISETVQRKGMVLIPSFAVGRTQQILYLLRELKEEGRIPDVPVIVDSPMARDATSLYLSYGTELAPTLKGMLKKGLDPLAPSKLAFVKSREESVKLNSIHDPMVLISAGGMLSGGRILHHLVHRLGNPRNSILFVGYQPPMGRGGRLLAGAEKISLFHQDITVQAHIEEISGLSAHADREELLRWCEESTNTPDKVFVVHGEPESAESFSSTLQKEFGWHTSVTKYEQTEVL